MLFNLVQTIKNSPINKTYIIEINLSVQTVSHAFSSQGTNYRKDIGSNQFYKFSSSRF